MARKRMMKAAHNMAYQPLGFAGATPTTSLGTVSDIASEAATSQSARVLNLHAPSQLIIDQPAEGTVYWIDETPVMPLIQCRAQINGVDPDPTDQATFSWQIDIIEHVRPASADSPCLSSLIGDCRLSVSTQGGATWTPTFERCQGGDAQLTVTAIFPSQDQTQQLTATARIRIRGRNPSTDVVSQALGGKGTIADLIACKESTPHHYQFFPEGMKGETAGEVYINHHTGDVGIMQLCTMDAPFTCEQRWNWRKNVEAGMALLSVRRADALRHLNRHTPNGPYLNDMGLPDDKVVDREMIQRYKGGAYWHWDAKRAMWIAKPPLKDGTSYVDRVLSCT